MVYVTRHAEKRMIKRVGINKSSTGRIAQKVLDNGYTINQTKGKLKRWLLYTRSKNTNLNNIRVYGDKVYLFIDDNLITVLQVPTKLTKEVCRLKRDINQI